MSITPIIAAAAASWIFGAIWHLALAKPRRRAAHLSPTHRSGGLPYVLSAIAMLLVAAMMQSVFALSAIDTIVEGTILGFCIGLFFITPWIAINNAFAVRPFVLTVIDGGHAILGCTIVGAVLTLLG